MLNMKGEYKHGIRPFYIFMSVSVNFSYVILYLFYHVIEFAWADLHLEWKGNHLQAN